MPGARFTRRAVAAIYHFARGADYIADVLEGAGLKLELTLQEEAEDQYEEEFADLLHFKTLEDAEVSVMRLDELMRKFRSHRRKIHHSRSRSGQL